VMKQSTRDLQRVIRYRCCGPACAGRRRNRVTSVIRYPTNTTIFRCQ
jgi:hypothetical protein